MRATLVLVVMGLAGSARADDDISAIEKAVPACDPKRATCFGIHLHIARGADGLAATSEFVVGQLERANHHFATADVGFQLARVDTVADTAMHVATRADRSALAAGGLAKRVIHVFVVGQLDDIDVEGAQINGVAWRIPRDKTRKFLIVSAKAWDRTLAHELGHFFGLPHSTYAISIMNKTERAEPPQDQRTFAEEEFTALRAAVAKFVRSRVLATVKPPVDPAIKP